MTGVGMNLTEYSHKQLQALWNSVTADIIAFDYLESTDNFDSDDYEAREYLKQWALKIAEAQMMVKPEETTQAN